MNTKFEKVSKLDGQSKKNAGASGSAKRSTSTAAPKEPPLLSSAHATEALALLERHGPVLAQVEPKPLRVSIDALVGDARMIQELAQRHRPALLGVGLRPATLDDLGTRIALLMAAQAIRRGARASRSATELTLIDQGYALRAELLTIGDYAFRDDLAAKQVLSSVREGSGLEDLMADLLALAELFENKASLVSDTGEDPRAHARMAREHQAALAAEVTRRKVETVGGIEEVSLRDRAATHLYAGMSEVRTAAIFAFRKEPATQLKFKKLASVTRPKRAVAEAEKDGVVTPEE